MTVKQIPANLSWGHLKMTATVVSFLILGACGAADLTGESKKRAKQEVGANQTGLGAGGEDDSVEQYGTTADGRPCLKLVANQPGQNPGQNTPGQYPGKGNVPPPTVNPPPGDGREPGPLPPCGPGQTGKDGGKAYPRYPHPDLDVAVDINKNGYGPNQNGKPCVGPLCIFVGVGVGKGGPGCQGPQCPPPGQNIPPPPPGQNVPPPPPGECPAGHGKLWNKWSQWKKGAC